MTAFWSKKNKGTEEKTDDKSVISSDEKKVKKEEKASKQKREEKKDLKKDKKKKKGTKKSKVKVNKDKADIFNRVLVQPKISEASLKGQEIGKYVFIVAPFSTKQQIKEAVEAKYGVSVKEVNTMKYKSRKKNFRGAKGTKKGFKKAVVQLKEGEAIEFFSEK